MTTQDAADATLDRYYREHASAVRAYVGKLANGNDDVDDAVSAAFLRALAVLRAGGTVASPRAWLCVVASRLLVDCARGGVRRRTLARDSMTRQVDSVDPGRVVAARDELAAVGALVGALPSGRRGRAVLRAGLKQPPS